MNVAKLGLSVVALAAAFVLLSGIGVAAGSKTYESSVVLDSATSLVKGAPVRVNGFKAGEITDIAVVDDKAKIMFTLDDEFAPLHDGAAAQIGWKATLSERQLEITDGDEKSVALPSGGMLRGQSVEPVELADVLAALDAPTRKKLQGTLSALSASLEGSEKDANKTLATAGPALAQLSSVLKAVGTDGPAIKNLVTRLDSLMTLIGNRDEDVRAMVGELGTLTKSVAAQRDDLRATLQQLPTTLDGARATLDDVPGTVDEVTPLLEALAPATEKLGPTARNLRPVLTDLRPLIGQLRPALVSLDQLLETTPTLLDSAHSALPQATKTVGMAERPVAFLRPYAPEVTGFFSTWASAFANYDSNGNFARIHGQAGLTSFNENPGIVPPGITYDPYPEPGAIVGQEWTDAQGSELR